MFYIVFIMMLLSLIISNYYIGLRIFGIIKHFTAKDSKAVPVVVGALSLFLLVCGFIHVVAPLPSYVKSAMKVISAYWMGFFVYFLLFFIGADIVVLCFKIFKKATPKVRLLSRILAVVFTVVTMTYGMYNGANVRTKSYNLSLGEDTRGMKIALVSDIHLGAVGSEDRLADMAEAINKADVDLVCIAGDIFDNDYYAVNDPGKAIQILKGIKSKYGAYACFGNHDAGNSVDKMKEFLEESNIHLLADSYVNIDNRFILLGRNDPHPIGKGLPDGGRSEAEEVLRGTDGSLPVIVMDHNPGYIGEYGDKADLILCGHTHKGQIFPGNIITDLMYEADYGYYRRDEKSPHVIVSSGVGTWGLPVRVGTQSEVVIITLE